MDIYPPPTMQREALLKFAEALGSAANALRRDECGDPCINGRRGHIYACSDGYRRQPVHRENALFVAILLDAGERHSLLGPSPCLSRASDDIQAPTRLNSSGAMSA